ncbi:MAG: hypothetical protein IJW21_02830 [Clostridia bacterium]|nr:hypothetical protein [Clostridia bacterium]
MKKNLYSIMNEANEREMEALLENIEYEMPEDVSQANIAAKAAMKRRSAAIKARTLWLRYGAVAACFALIVAAVPAAQHFGNPYATNDKLYHEGSTNGVSIPEIGFVTSPSIAFETSISYLYHLPLEDGSVLCKEVFFKLEEGHMKETWRELLAPFFEHCGLDVTVANWKLTETDANTEVSPDGQVVTHTPGVKTVHIYLERTAVLDDQTLKCLVNTSDSISYVRYIKLYMNGEPVAIDGECPEEGFVNFNFVKAE